MININILAVLLALMVFMAGCGHHSNTQSETQTVEVQNSKILTTFYPIQEITNEIVKDTLEVEVLVGVGIEPHSFEPTPSQIVSLSQANIFITMEGMFEHIEGKIIESNPSINIIEASHNVELIKGEDHHDEHHEESHDEDHHDEHHEESHDEDHHDEHHEESHDEDHHDEHHEESHDEDHHDEHHEESHDEDHHDEHHEGEDSHDHHNHGEYDPHIWLSINNMKIMTNEILEGLVELYPENAQLYESNALVYLQKLDELEEEYNLRLAECKYSKVIVNHKAFGYLADRYGFEQISVAGFAPESEPSPKTIQSVIDEAKKHNLNYVFSEGQIDPKTAKTIADDIGGEVLELNPLKLNDNETYFSIMRKNLDNLAIGLNCSN